MIGPVLWQPFAHRKAFDGGRPYFFSAAIGDKSIDDVQHFEAYHSTEPLGTKPVAFLITPQIGASQDVRACVSGSSLGHWRSLQRFTDSWSTQGISMTRPASLLNGKKCQRVAWLVALGMLPCHL